MNEWITYDWHVHGSPAEFFVNMAYAEDTPAAYGALLYCALAPAQEDAALFTRGEYKRLARVEAKLKRLLPDALYVGYIHMDALRQLYFYVRDAEAALSVVEEFALGERKLHAAPGVTEEADWITYHKLLLPDAAKHQTIYNGQLIERQRAGGDALEKARRVTFFICFATDQQRQFFNEDARHAGFAIGDALFQPELALSHAQTLYAITSLDKRDMDELTTRIIHAAVPHDGELLRWTCPKMAKRSPLS